MDILKNLNNLLIKIIIVKYILLLLNIL